MKKLVYVHIGQAVLSVCVAGVFMVFHSPMIKMDTIGMVENIDRKYVRRDQLNSAQIRELNEFKRFIQYNEDAHWEKHRLSRMVVIYGFLLSAAVSLVVAWFLARRVCQDPSSS
ncbi:hypothetical protein [Acidovorax sp. M2(2025)]|uniref:hypothetical protein n=1 Tax=Acidovorax sp. M2(2025) TaxID=3411355 RepID=UPI003BF5AE05